MRLADAMPFVACVVVTGCLGSAPPITPYGHPVSVRGIDGTRERGELLASTRDSVWIASRARLLAFEAAGIHEVRLRRHEFGFQQTLKWMLVAGLATGTALMVSCNNYYASEGGSSGGDCMVPLVAMPLSFGVAGLLFGALNERSMTYRIRPNELHRLPPFSRYPQGLPDTVRHILTAPRH